MNIAISGGEGFIGKKLVNKLLKKNHKIRLLTRKNKTSKQTNIEYFQGDVTKVESLKGFFSKIDTFYHCCGEVVDEDKMLAVNVDGIINLLKELNEHKLQWIQLSSIGVYGSKSNGKINENTPPKPFNTYEKTKLKADQILLEYLSKNLLEHSILRPSIVFGENMPNQSLFQLIKMIQKGKFFYIGNRKSMTNYVYVDKVVDALIYISENKNCNGKIFNLSDCLSLEDFVNEVQKNLGTTHNFIRLPKTPIKNNGQLIKYYSKKSSNSTKS